MIPVIYRKGEYLKTLKYMLNKKEAEVIDTNLAGNKANEFNEQFLATKSIKPELKNPCAHLILSIANNTNNRESLSNEQWTSVARRYLQELEYLPKEQNVVPSQYVTVRHHDREHEHLHIITSQIRFDGSKVNDSFDYFKAQTATRLIAHEMGLEVTPTSSKAVSDKLRKEYGIDAAVSDNRSKSIRSIKCKSNEPSTKDTIKNVLFSAINESNSMAEFLDKVESQQVYPIVRLDKNQQILGFAYTHKGVTVAANQVSRKLSWNKFKDTLKFDIKESDLQLILLAREKAKADISRHKSKSKSKSIKTNSDSASSGNKENPVQTEVKQKTRDFISVVPSIETIFPSPDKKPNKSKPTSKIQSSKQEPVTPKDKTDNPKSFVSVVPSIETIFPSPIQHKDKVVAETEVAETPNKPVKNEDVNVVEPSSKVKQTLPVDSTKPNSNSNNSSSKNSIGISEVHNAVRTIAAYMAFINKTEVDGDTLTARLNGNTLILKDLQSDNTLIEAEYSTRTNQWDIKQSKITEAHLKRIAQLQKRLPKYEIQEQNYQNGQER